MEKGVKDTKDKEIEKIKRQMQLIHRLARILPWIVVSAVLATALFYVTLAFLHLA